MRSTPSGWRGVLGAVGAGALALSCHTPACLCVDPGTEAFLVESEVDVAELEAWAWLEARPATPDRWRPLTEAQLQALERLITELLDASDRGRLSAAQRHELAQLAGFVGVQLREASVRVDGRTVELWVVHEPGHDRRGRGTYLIRRGPVGGRARARGGVEILLQAPHSRFDRRTGALALRLLLDSAAAGRGEAPRALFLNSAHRYRQPDGSRVALPRAEANLADAAHNPNHPLARATAAAVREHELVVVQLHGFGPDHERDHHQAQPAIVISSGRARPDRASAAAYTRLRATLPELRCDHHGLDRSVVADRLGAEANVQGRAARAWGRCFVHVELAEPVRQRLLADPALRAQFAAALFGSASEEARGGCR